MAPVLALVLALLLACASGSGCGPAHAQHASELNAGATKNLAYLQQNYASSVVSTVPWAGSWWPYSSDGISSATAKYDAVTFGSATRWEHANHGTGRHGVPDWFGHCNGWAAAAILSREPQGTRSIGGQDFSVADRKALLSETYMEVSGDFIGTRVEDPSDFSSEAFNDVWPAQMLLVLTSVVGAQKRAVGFDRNTGYQVWNQPLVAYVNEKIKPEDYLGPDPDYPNIYRVNMTTTLYWVSDNVEPDIATPGFDVNNPASVFESRTLSYELWVDAPLQFDSGGNLTASGDVILTTQNGHTSGGIWKNGNLPLVESHPDYMWIPTGPAPSSGFKNPQLDDAWVLSNMAQ